MFCRNCGNQMSDNARFCSKCGTPVQPEQPIQQMQPEPSVQPTQQTQPVQPVQPTQQIQPGQPVQPMPPVQPVQPAPAGTAAKAKKEKPPKKKSGKAKAAIAAVVIVAVIAVSAVSIVANASIVGNFIHKTFTSPEQYYQYVETRSASQLASQTGSMYGMMAENWLNVYDRDFRGELSVELGEDGQEYLALLRLAGVDLTWLRSAAVGMNYSVRDNLIGMGTSLTLNEDAIASMNVLMDMKENGMYFQIPELTQAYLGIHMGMFSDFDGAAQFDMIRRQQELSGQLAASLPGRADVEALVGRYMGIVLECIHDVTIGTKNVKAGGVEQQLTELEVTVDAATAQEIAQAVLKAVRNDEDIEKFIVGFAAFAAGSGSVYVDANEVYDTFCDRINETLLALQDLGDSDGEVIMKVYVNNKGEIKGRVFEWTRVTAAAERDSSGKISIDSSGVTESFRMLTAEKGKSFGYEMAVASGDESISFTGSGIRSDGEMNGDFTVKYNGVSLIEVGVSGLNIEKAEAGLIEGAFEVQLSSKIASLMNSYTPGRTVLDNLKLMLVFQASEDVRSVEANITYNEEELGTVTMTVYMDGGSMPAIPDRNSVIMVTNEADAENVMTEWLETIDWDTVISRLEETDLPDSVIQQLQGISEAVKTGNTGKPEFRGIRGISW